MLRGTLEASGQWDAVRVCPENVQFVDVSVSGKIIESTGAKLALQVTVKDSTGRVWLNNKQYASSADTGSYKTDAALRARDPFQDVYSEVANDMLATREALVVQNRRDIRRVTQLEFAKDIAPQAMDGLDAKTHAQASMELSDFFQNEVAPQVVDVEGRTLKLTGTAEEQYREWRKLLNEMYLEENGPPADGPLAAPLPAMQPVALDPAH
jgi:hypothetical protein